MEKVSSVIIGAGVLGCAIAQKLAEVGDPPIILEAGPRIAEGVTSRNSGVIHAALYYPPNSMKANSCLRGKQLLKEWCRKYEVPWKETGKWIVAQKGEAESLSDLMQNAIASGATGLTWKTGKQLESALPLVQGESAIFSEETGIVDPYALTRSFLFAAEEKGAILMTSAPVTSIEKCQEGFIIHTPRDSIACERVFNAAGLFADEVARMAGVDKYRIYPWRGDYFRLKRDFGIKTLIYPSRRKGAPGLGIHLTVELDGRCKFGPDVEYEESKVSFEPRPEKAGIFLSAIQSYLPSITLADLQYDTCGLRPKLRAVNDKAEHDFILSEDLPGFTNCIGIESPGLTAAMALAEMIVRP